MSWRDRAVPETPAKSSWRSRALKEDGTPLEDPGAGGIKQTISELARPALEAGGALGGAALATAAGLPTGPGAVPIGVAGGALGFAGGRATADLLDRAMGLKKPLSGPTEALKETGGNIVSGMAQEAGGAAMGKGLEVGGKLLKAGGKRLLSLTTGVPVKDIGARAARNAEIKAAKPFEVLAQELPEDVQKLSEHVGELSEAAFQTLSRSGDVANGAQAKATLVKAVNREMRALGRSVSDASSKANGVLKRYAERLGKLRDTVSEKELGQIIRDIDNDIDWSSKDMTPLNNALEAVRTNIDKILKTQNQEYAAAMIPVAEGTRLLKRTQRLFQIESEAGKGFKPTNATAASLKGALHKARVDSQEVLEALKKVTGRDYLREADAAAIAEKFRGGKIAGSRRVNLGTVLGGVAGAGTAGPAGGGAGALLGAGAGAYLDEHGGEVAGSVVDQLVRLTQRMGPNGLLPIPSEAFRRLLAATATSKAEQDRRKK